MKGWVGLIGWPVVDGLPTLVVTHQLQVERRTGKVRRPETDVLPLCHATNHLGSPGKRAIERVCVCVWNVDILLFCCEFQDEILATEKVLVEGLRFDLLVELPYLHLLKYIRLLQGRMLSLMMYSLYSFAQIRLCQWIITRQAVFWCWWLCNRRGKQPVETVVLGAYVDISSGYWDASTIIKWTALYPQEFSYCWIKPSLFILAFKIEVANVIHLL